MSLKDDVWISPTILKRLTKPIEEYTEQDFKEDSEATDRAVKELLSVSNSLKEQAYKRNSKEENDKGIFATW